ncbi:MAG: geranylgeranylglycerol-phosphate geranylgeranyltransferase [Bacteroidota bacterium]
MALLKLIRFPNLVIVGLTQYLLFHLLLQPAFHSNGINSLLDTTHFFLLSLVTLILTATGYIINDIIDLPIDRLNKPHKLIISKRIALQTAVWLYFCLLLGGFFVSVYLAFFAGNPTLLTIYPLAFTLLFVYSAAWKKQPLIGNVVVAVFCAGVAWILLFAEEDAMAVLQEVASDQAQYITQLFYWYMVFAFLATMFREIVKDLEDMEGDRVHGCRTLPIALGQNMAKVIAFGFGVSLVVFLLAMGWNMDQLFQRWGAWAFVGISIVLPTIVALALLYRATQKQEFHRISQIAKWIMLFGLLFLMYSSWI